MSDLIKQKQVENLGTDLASKASTSQVLSRTGNLSDIQDSATARTNLDIHSKAEVNALIGGASSGISVADIAARNALSGLNVSDRIFVSDDGDGKWAMYIVTTVSDGSGATSEYVKVADEDLFANAMTASAVKTSYESNANTNEFSDAEQTKLSHISVTQAVDLDGMESDISNNAGDIATAQTTANNAQTTANAAQTTANSKEDSFTEIKETFTGVVVEANMDNDLILTYSIKAGFEVLVYFGTLLVENVTWTPGSKTVSVNVPYLTESSDKIYVFYKY